MICTSCEKRQAVLLVHHLVGNKVVQKALCADCAAGEEAAPAEVLQALLEELARLRVKVHPTRCPSCHTTFAQFRAKGRFGCPDCYGQFEPQVRGLLPRIHGGAYQHRGKVPRGAR